MEHLANRNIPEEKPSGTGSMVKDVGGEYLKGAAKEGGQRTMEYEAEHGQEQLDEAKAKAQVGCQSRRRLRDFQLICL